MFSSSPAPREDGGASGLAGSPRPPGAWLFGKLPAHGDFIGRGLSPEMCEQLDLWLLAELARARARFADFDERYRLAPPWAFRDCDPAGNWSGGALCLSVDAVGRRFPILVAAPAAGPGEAWGVADAALELVFGALGEGWEAPRLHDALGEIVSPDASPDADPSCSADDEPGWVIAAEDGTRIEASGRYPDGLIERMMELVE